MDKELNNSEKRHLGGFGGGNELARVAGRRRRGGTVAGVNTVTIVGGRKHRPRAMKTALDAAGLSKKKFWSKEDLARAVAGVVAAAAKAGKPDSIARTWLRNFVRRHRIAMATDAVLGGPFFVGGPFGQVPRSTIPGTTTLFVSGEKAGSPDDPTDDARYTAHRTLPSTVREAFVGAGPGRAPRTIHQRMKTRAWQPEGYAVETGPRAQLRTVRETFVGGPYGQVPRATIPGTTTLFVGGKKRPTIHQRMKQKAWQPEGYDIETGPRAQLRNVRETFVGAADTINRSLPTGQVPAAAIDRLLHAKSALFQKRTGRLPGPVGDKWKRNLLNAVQKQGATVVGEVTYIGDWLSSLAKVPGAVISKGVELAGRHLVAIPKAALGVARGGADFASNMLHGKPLAAVKALGSGAFGAVKTLTYDPIKGTFFKPKPPAPPRPGAPAIPPMAPIVPPDYYSNPNVPRMFIPPGAAAPIAITPSVAQMAAQIAQRKGWAKAQSNELAARIELANNRKQLAELELAERQKVAELDAQAAAAEAEAAQAEADLQVEESMGGADLETILGYALRANRRQTLMGEAVEAKVAKAVLATAGDLAKATILDTRWGKLFNGLKNIFKAAKADPQGPAKVAELKKEAAKGDPAAEKVIDALKLGKKVDEQLKAAKVVEAELTKKNATTAAKVSGMGSDEVAIIGALLPTKADPAIATVPGADAVYKLAKGGNSEMLKSVGFAAELLKKSAAGDAAAQKTIADYGQRAKAGDKTAQLFEAAAAVAAAGIREEKALAATKAKPGVQAAVKQQTGRMARLKAGIKHAGQTVKQGAKDAGSYAVHELKHAADELAAKQGQGTALKIAMGTRS